MGLVVSKERIDAGRIEEIWPWVWAIRDPEQLDWRNKLNSEEITRQARRQSQLPVEILPYIFLGNAHCASNVSELKRMKITHVLNVAGPPSRGPVKEYEEARITYKEIYAEDEEGYPMLKNHFKECRGFIEDAKEEGGRCLVHCVAGMNRSGLIVSATMMLDSNCPVLDVVVHCRTKRGNTFLLNESFQEQLCFLARRKNLLGVQPGEDGSVVCVAAPEYQEFAKKMPQNFKQLF